MKIYKNKILLMCSMMLFLYTSSLTGTSVGSGSYLDGTAPQPPEDPVYKTSKVTGSIPFADWWTSILIVTNTDLLAAFPLYFKVKNSTSEDYGLTVFYPGIGKFYGHDFNECTWMDDNTLDHVDITNVPEITVRAKAWINNNLTTRVDDYSDWTVTMEINDGTLKTNLVTIVKGSPFFYIITKNCEEEIYFSSPIKKAFTTTSSDVGLSITHPITNDHLAFSVTNRYYVVFSSSNTIFKMVNQNKIIISNFNNYLSIAILKQESDLNTFYLSAYAFVSNTMVSYNYNESTSEVTINYNFNTKLMRNGFSDIPITCLFPHHYKHTTASMLTIEYPTLRGNLKAFQGKSFNTVLKFNGILPYFPEPVASGYSRETLKSYINNAVSKIGFHSTVNTYWAGRSLAKCAKLIPIADGIGETSSKNYFINILKAELIDWLSSDDGIPYYCYFNNWGCMIGYPTGYPNNGFYTWELCDLHFHHGYFIYSSALLSMFDSSFMTGYGGMVDLLIRNCNSPDRNDSMFAYMNYLDIYEGHSWASGYGKAWINFLGLTIDMGNNQESSSEAMNFWIGAYLWGLISGNNTYRDLGIFGYVLENSAIDEYYFDKDEEIFHTDYKTHTCCTILWGGKYMYNIWWCPKDIEWMHLIEWVPVTPSSMYLGYDPVYSQKNFNEMKLNDPTPEDKGCDTIWKFEALFDPDDAINKFNNKDISYLDGDHQYALNTQAEVYHFLYNLKGIGNVSTEYYADVPSYNVFNNNDEIIFVGYNPESTEKDIHFYKSGDLKYTLNVPALSVKSSKKIPSEDAITNDDGISFSISQNIKASVTFPNPFYLSKDNEIKFCIFENNVIKGFPHDTTVSIYDITGDQIWKSKKAEIYEYNIIPCQRNVFQKVNETLICIVENKSVTKKFKLVILK